ncbi:MAG TPA: bifunctional riboflavin kinase/FAD synthetase [Hellea balneolensis]|uniref:Riboflavin biosynthesis protein n=1 Tax=Hellea balneolensis TaxID=287478 RepID=A0A7C5LRC1_9PROT|nr:bifunctional riboflavin kinase/FAD synthetase [Hellea balneolensis]
MCQNVPKAIRPGNNLRVLTTYKDLSERSRGAVIALGNFDGLHRGHQVVINKAAQIAKDKAAPLGIACFHPHPVLFFKPDTEPFRLMSRRVRARLLSEMHVDRLYDLPFDKELASMDDEEFVETVLHKGLGVLHVVVGTDFKYGKGRCGNYETLKTHCQARGIGITGIEPISLHQSYGKYGSTEIRNALRDGDVFFAAHMLSRPWIVDGEVMHGDQLGRTLGFPTANIYFNDRLRPKPGIYAAQCRLEGESIWRHGIAYVGDRPTVDGKDHRLEMHIFDFDADIYGSVLDVAFRTFIREDVKFDGLDSLKAQMQKDCDGARAIFGLL